MPKPQWLRAKAPVGENFHDLKKLARGLGLHTVCESAQCPNIGECWNHKTATFMLLGDICTRRCGFCAVPKGRPESIDWAEPRRVAEAEEMLAGSRLDAAAIDRVIALARAAAAPQTDLHASSDYRRHLVGVLAGRALAAAWQRAMMR